MFIFFYLLGFIHPLATAFDLIYFLGKTIKKTLVKSLYNQRYVNYLFI